MKPIEFEGVNKVYGENQPQYIPLPVQKDENGRVISCWELTDEELEKIKETKRIWIGQLTFNQPLQPILPSADKKTIEDAEY